MNITLKKGKVTDLHIVLGRHFEHHSASFPKLFSLLTENNINYSYTDKEEAFYSIQFYINPNKKQDKDKEKMMIETTAKTKKTESLDINSLLSKYSYQPQAKTTAFAKPKPKMSEDLELKMCLIYINNLNINEMIPCFETLRDIDLKGVKHIFMLECVQDLISSNEIKTKRQKKDLILSQQLGSQSLSQSQPFSFGGEDIESSQSNLHIRTTEELDEFLMSLSIESELDYKLTSSPEDTLDFLKECVTSMIESKYKSNLGYFDVKGHSHTMISVYAGFEDLYSLSWIEFLMTVPGISEEKAVAIAKEYPTMKMLMDELEKNPNLKLLEDIKVVHNYNESKAKRLGKAASAKIVKILTSTNPNEIL